MDPRFFWAMVGGLSIGCGRSTDPVRPAAPIAPPAIEGGTTTAAADAGAPPGPPRTGLYELEVTVDFDSCGFSRGPERFDALFLILVKIEEGRMTLNAPLVPPARGRFDIEAEPHPKNRSVLRDPACRGFETTLDLEVVQAQGDTIRMTRSEKFGDGSGCAPPPPRTQCARDTTLTYRLRTPLCEARCNPTNVRPLPDGGVDLKCECRER